MTSPALSPGSQTGGGNTISVERDLRGQATRIDLPQGGSIRRTFDAVGRITSISVEDALANETLSVDLTRAIGGRVTQIARSSGGQSTYRYDALGQLVEETITEAASSESLLYEYDPKGNVSSRTDGAGTVSFVTDLNDRLLSDGPFQNVWDDNGRLRSRTTAGSARNYEYDAEGRLVRFERTGTNPVEVTYEYDHDGLLRTRIASGVRTDFSWDRSATPLPQLLEQKTQGLHGVRYFSMDAALLGLVDTATGTPTFLVTDHLGTVCAVIDSSGAVVEELFFDGFGRLRAGTVPEGVGYAGAYTDPDSGLLFMRSRWYSPEMARFVQPDVLLGVPTDTRSLNPYAYSFNDPINKVDPAGTSPLTNLNLTLNIVSTLATVALTFPDAFGVLLSLFGLDNLPFQPWDATTVGASVTISHPAVPFSGTGGLEFLQFFDGVNALYGYLGIGLQLGAGFGGKGFTNVSAGPVGGLVFNTPNPKAYTRYFLSLSFSGAYAKRVAVLALRKSPQLPRPISRELVAGSRSVSVTLSKGAARASRGAHSLSVSPNWSLTGDRVARGWKAKPGRKAVSIGFSWYWLFWDSIGRGPLKGPRPQGLNL